MMKFFYCSCQRSSPECLSEAQPAARERPPVSALVETLPEYERAQNQIKVLKASGYTLRSIKQYRTATCYMCGKTFNFLSWFLIYHS